MRIQALLVDVDGVLVTGRPSDGRHWQTTLQADLGVSPDALGERFFAPHWDDIVTGRIGIREPLAAALQAVAPHLTADELIAYWFANDARVNTALLAELAHVRAAGIAVHLATNQEPLRARYLMHELRLAEHVDGMLCSAQLGAKKPDHAFFRAVEDTLGLRGAELLLIDDASANIAAARQCGWRAMPWTHHGTPDLVWSACN